MEGFKKESEAGEEDTVSVMSLQTGIRWVGERAEMVKDWDHRSRMGWWTDLRCIQELREEEQEEGGGGGSNGREEWEGGVGGKGGRKQEGLIAANFRRCQSTAWRTF